MADKPLFIGGYRNVATVRTSANTTVAQVVFTADATNGSRVHAINVYSDDTASQTLRLILNDGTSDCELYTVTIPAQAGDLDATGPISLLNETKLDMLDASPGRFLTLGAGDTLKVATTGTITAAKSVKVAVFAGDY